MLWEVLESLLVQRLKNYSISELGTNIVMCASMPSPLDVNKKKHQCFKNWDSSSQAMEADIILEGFLKANEYGVRYMTIIADGDSSTYARIQEEVPVWGRQVKKGESNHVCKCLRGILEKLVDGNPSYKGKGNLTKALRVRITSAVRCDIRMRSAEKDHKRAAKLYKETSKIQ